MKQEKQKPTTRNVLKKFGVGAMLTATMFCTGGLLSGCMADGKDGKDGTNAAAWYYGTYTPTLDNRPGQVGDYYIDQDDNKIYQLTDQGWKEVANFGSGTQGPAGQPGADGEDGVTPHIGANGNWYIGTQDTGIKAQGQNGVDGQDGVTPHIGANGNWWIGTQDTGVKAQGQDGSNGTNGQDGKDGSSIITGAIDPNNTTGKDGDIFLNVSSYDLFKKSSGVWTKIGNIKSSQDEGREYYTNLFDSSNEGIVADKWITNSNTEQDRTGYCYSYLIPVEANKTYLYNIPWGHLYGNNYGLYHTYDENGQWIKAAKAEVYDDNGIAWENGVTPASILDDYILKITITDANVKYIRLNMGTSKLGQAMFVPGEDFPDKYVGYNEIVYKDSYISLKASEYEMLLKQNPLYKKSIAFEGDSIGAGSGNNKTSYANYIAENNTMTMVNNSVGGGTITNGIYSSSGGLRHSIVEGIRKLVAEKDKYDYIIFEGVTNDFGNRLEAKEEGYDNSGSTAVPFGEMSSGYYATLDESTFCGAFESCCKMLAKSGKKVGYIFVHRMTSSAAWTETYKPTMIKILEKWGVSYIDLERTTPPIGNETELRDLYTADTKDTGHGDGVHPNELGYKTFYVDQITQWLKTL